MSHYLSFLAQKLNFGSPLPRNLAPVFSAMSNRQVRNRRLSFTFTRLLSFYFIFSINLASIKLCHIDAN
jgi:hypothetical protein